MECFRLLLEHLAWIDHQFLSGIRDSRKAVSLYDERCGRSKEGFKGVQEEIPSEEASSLQSGQWHFHQDNAPVHNSILVKDNLTKMGIKTVHQPPYSPDLSPCDFWLFSQLTGCRYETIEEIKEAVTKVIDTLTQEDFDVAFQKLLERYNECIAAKGDYLEGD